MKGLLIVPGSCFKCGETEVIIREMSELTLRWECRQCGADVIQVKNEGRYAVPADGTIFFIKEKETHEQSNQARRE